MSTIIACDRPGCGTRVEHQNCKINRELWPDGAASAFAEGKGSLDVCTRCIEELGKFWQRSPMWKT